MNFSLLKKSLESGENFPVYLVEGEDAYFRASALKALKLFYVNEPSINFASFDGENLKDFAQFSDFLISLTSYPFMSEKRMTAVHEYYPSKDAVKKISELISSRKTESSVLVIVNEKMDENLKKLPSVCVVECKKGDANLLARWVKGTCEREGVSIELETASILCEYCLCDMARISTETEKLICFALNKKIIEKNDIHELVYQDSEYKIYEMTDFIAKKRIDKAMTIVNELLSKGETEQRLLLSIYNYFRRLLHVAISSLNEAEIAKAFNIKEFAVKKIKAQASTFKKIALKKAVDVLEEADYKCKCGRADIGNEFYLALFKILLGG